MQLSYLGHSAFLMESSSGTRLLLDPYQPDAFEGAVRYAPIDDSCDILAISHDHEDHNEIETLASAPLVIRQSSRARDIQFTIIPTWHDNRQGELRGPNRIMRITMDGITVVHCGDLGHELDESHEKALGKVDVLLIPVGGRFTIGPEEAGRITDRLQPRIVVPMHYKTQDCSMPLGGVEPFLENRGQYKRASNSVIELEEGRLPEPTQTVVIQYRQGSRGTGNFGMREANRSL